MSSKSLKNAPEEARITRWASSRCPSSQSDIREVNGVAQIFERRSQVCLELVPLKAKDFRLHPGGFHRTKGNRTEATFLQFHTSCIRLKESFRRYLIFTFYHLVLHLDFSLAVPCGSVRLDLETVLHSGNGFAWLIGDQPTFA